MKIEVRRAKALKGEIRLPPDRIQAQSAALLVGLCFENRLVEAVPMEAHDIRMDVVATEKRMIFASTAEAKLENLIG